MNEPEIPTALTIHPPQSSLIERHLQTLLLFIVTGLIAWQGMTSLKLTDATARQDERIQNLTLQVTEVHRELRDQRNNYVPRPEVEQAFEEVRDRIRVIEGRLPK